MERHNEEN